MTVTFHGSVQESARGEEFFEAEGARSVRSLIDLLGEHYGEPFKEFLLGEDTCFFLVNGSGIMTTGGLRTPLRQEDTIEVLPFVNGG